MKTYKELVRLPTFEERIAYLKLNGSVGKETFGSHRYLNQRFYMSKEWRQFRNHIIVRDNACDLGITGHEIVDNQNGKIFIHHINPIEEIDIIDYADSLMNPDNVICCSFNTHQYIHYGTDSLYPKTVIERTKNDTCPWR